MAWLMCVMLIGALYSIVWIVLFIFPELIHKTKQNQIRGKLIAHRGGAGEELENTLTAFKRAAEKDVDMLELDCYLTRDSHVVVSHDPHLLTLTGEDVYIHDIDYKDLPCLKPVLELDFAKGQTCCGNPNDRNIPLLREVFEQCPGVPINLDVGTDNDALIDKVIKMVIEFKREDITILGNTNENMTRKLHAKAPELLLFFSEQSFYRLLKVFYLGLIPFVSFKESFLEIPLGSVLKDAGMKNWIFTTFPRIYDAVVLNPLLIFHLHRRGIKVFMWVLNTEEQWEQGFAYGADAVITDYPSKLRDYTNKKKL
ncbi:lysophospholipase D GDPD1-like [Lytechinus pictus]|uniref:lysophospholipase D GDPD1-like n=1 Tax=Lytechinus pictus TaxID=7653 RepID=UPI0030BA15F7